MGKFGEAICLLASFVAHTRCDIRNALKGGNLKAFLYPMPRAFGYYSATTTHTEDTTHVLTETPDGKENFVYFGKQWVKWLYYESIDKKLDLTIDTYLSRMITIDTIRMLRVFLTIFDPIQCCDQTWRLIMMNLPTLAKLAMTPTSSNERFGIKCNQLGLDELYIKKIPMIDLNDYDGIRISFYKPSHECCLWQEIGNILQALDDIDEPRECIEILNEVKSSNDADLMLRNLNTPLRNMVDPYVRRQRDVTNLVSKYIKESLSPSIKLGLYRRNFLSSRNLRFQTISLPEKYWMRSCLVEGLRIVNGRYIRPLYFRKDEALVKQITDTLNTRDIVGEYCLGESRDLVMLDDEKDDASLHDVNGVRRRSTRYDDPFYEAQEGELKWVTANLELGQAFTTWNGEEFSINQQNDNWFPRDRFNQFSFRFAIMSETFYFINQVADTDMYCPIEIYGLGPREFSRQLKPREISYSIPPHFEQSLISFNSLEYSRGKATGNFYTPYISGDLNQKLITYNRWTSNEAIVKLISPIYFKTTLRRSRTAEIVPSILFDKCFEFKEVAKPEAIGKFPASNRITANYTWPVDPRKETLIKQVLLMFSEQNRNTPSERLIYAIRLLFIYKPDHELFRDLTSITIEVDTNSDLYLTIAKELISQTSKESLTKGTIFGIGGSRDDSSYPPEFNDRIDLKEFKTHKQEITQWLTGRISSASFIQTIKDPLNFFQSLFLVGLSYDLHVRHLQNCLEFFFKKRTAVFVADEFRNNYRSFGINLYEIMTVKYSSYPLYNKFLNTENFSVEVVYMLTKYDLNDCFLLFLWLKVFDDRPFSGDLFHEFLSRFVRLIRSLNLCSESDCDIRLEPYLFVAKYMKTLKLHILQIE